MVVYACNFWAIIKTILIQVLLPGHLKMLGYNPHLDLEADFRDRRARRCFPTGLA